jgi:hypothetical protein
MDTPPSPPPAPPPAACANCGAPFAPQRRRFCPECGQETHTQAPTLHEFAQQLGGAYFSTEGALWRTLKLLLLKPGELTRQYLAGRRKHYVLPLRLYLTISLITLLLVRVAGSAGTVKVEIKTPTAAEAAAVRNNLVINMGGGHAGLRDGKFFCDNLPGWVCQRLKRRIDIDPQQMGEEFAQLKERFLANLGAAMFVLLPSFALWLKLAYWNRRLRYTEHLVFALHVHAYWFVALAFMLPDQVWLTAPAFAAVPWYTLLAMRRVYGGRRWPRYLRALVISALYLLSMAVAFAAVGLWTVLA